MKFKLIFILLMSVTFSGHVVRANSYDIDNFCSDILGRIDRIRARALVSASSLKSKFIESCQDQSIRLTEKQTSLAFDIIYAYAMSEEIQSKEPLVIVVDSSPRAGNTKLLRLIAPFIGQKENNIVHIHYPEKIPDRSDVDHAVVIIDDNVSQQADSNLIRWIDGSRNKNMIFLLLLDNGKFDSLSKGLKYRINFRADGVGTVNMISSPVRHLVQ